MSAPEAHSSVTAIGQVAAREFGVRVRGRAFVLSTGFLLLIGVVGILVLSVFGGTDQARPQQVGVVGGGPTLSTALTQAGERAEQPLTPTAVSDPTAARAQVAAGDLDAALVAQADGSYAVVVESRLSAELRPVLTAGVEQAALDQALLTRGVPPQAVADQVATARLTVAPIEPPQPDAVQRTFIAYVLVVLLFFSVFFYGLNVAVGVVEEKSSRVVELLLSTIKPIDLLSGKVLGIGAVGLLQLVLVGGVALATSLATGLLTISGVAVTLFGIGLVWYVLGFLFYAMLYAAAGSLVSRQEDANAVTMPIMLVSFAAFIAAQIAFNAPGLTAITILSWIPPFSATLMPLRIAQGEAGGVEVGASIAIMIVATLVAAYLAARVYERSVLGSGSKQSLARALSRA